MADPAKYVCQIDGCNYGSEVTAFWKLGRGADIPFPGGKIRSRDGEHFQLTLCVRHRKQALAMDARPHRVKLTAWGARPGAFDLVLTDAGDLLVPGVAVAAKQGSEAV